MCTLKYFLTYFQAKIFLKHISSAAEYCVPVWCHSAHTRLIDSVLNDTLCMVTGCLHPTPTDHLPVLSGIQPAELCRMGATLSLAYHGSLDPNHILHGLLSGSSDTCQARLRSRRPFVPVAWNLLDNLARLGIHTSEWTNHKWKTEYCENASRLCAFVPETGARPVGMGLPQTAWVKLNCLRTGVGQFHSSMHKWGLVPSPNCKCGASSKLQPCANSMPYTRGVEPFMLGWPYLKLCLIIWPQNKNYFNLEQSRFVYSLIMIKIIT